MHIASWNNVFLFLNKRNYFFLLSGDAEGGDVIGGCVDGGDVIRHKSTRLKKS
jgi:hypothetical protein